MRQWWKLVALGAVAAMVVATPAAAFGGARDDAPQGATERVTETVMVQNQSQLGHTDVTVLGEQDMDRQRDRLQLRDGTGSDCGGDSHADGIGDQVRERDRLRDGTGDTCVGDCDGDRARDHDQLRQRLHDCTDGCEAAWLFARHYGWTMHLAI